MIYLALYFFTFCMFASGFIDSDLRSIQALGSRVKCSQFLLRLLLVRRFGFLYR